MWPNVRERAAIAAVLGTAGARAAAGEHAQIGDSAPGGD
jgi:hypothetical protein